MTKFEWQEKFLEAVANSCDEGREAVAYIQAHKTKVGLRRARKSVGALWTIFKSIHINASHYTQESSLADPYAWTLLIHEVRHLQQGPLTAYSIYGELDAWQYQLRTLKKLSGKQLTEIQEEILRLPLNMDRNNLKKAKGLMTRHGSIWYGAILLPLRPVHMTIKSWFTRK